MVLQCSWSSWKITGCSVDSKLQVSLSRLLIKASWCKATLGFNCGKVQTQNEPNIIDIIKSLYLMSSFWVHFECHVILYTESTDQWMTTFLYLFSVFIGLRKRDYNPTCVFHSLMQNKHAFCTKMAISNDIMTCLCSPCPHLPGSQVKPPLGCKTNLPHITSQLVSYCGSHSLGHQRRTQKTVQSLLQPERQSFIEQTPRSITENSAGKLISIVYHCFRSVSTHSWSRKRFIDIYLHILAKTYTLTYKIHTTILYQIRIWILCTQSVMLTMCGLCRITEVPTFPISLPGSISRTSC